MTNSRYVIKEIQPNTKFLMCASDIAPRNAVEPPRGMELQEKEKDQKNLRKAN